jgi:hypothetical protein
MNDMTTFNGGPAKQLNVKPQDTETSDDQREDGKMTSEDYYMIGTDIMVCHDVDDDDDVYTPFNWNV